jgi:urocanate reductase
LLTFQPNLRRIEMSKDESKSGSKISRRKFLAGTAVGAAGLVLAGSKPTVAQAQSQTPPWLPAKWDKEYDVVVVGSGAAGHSAAVAAAAAGAKVVLLEKLPTIGGNSRVSGGNYGTYCTGIDAVEQKHMKDEPFWFEGDSAELYYKEKLIMGGYRSEPECTRAFAYDSKAGYEWFIAHGYRQMDVGYYDSYNPIEAPNQKGLLVFEQRYNATYDKDGVWVGCFTKGRHHKSGMYTDSRGMTFLGGEGAIFCLADECDRLGVETICQMQVTEIFRENLLDGAVLGVRVKDLANNKVLDFRAKKGVILAAGGSHGNLEMVSHYDPRHSLARVNSGAASKGATEDGMKPGRGKTDSSGRGATGEVLVAAMDIGADVNVLGEYQLRWDRSTAAYTGPYSTVLTGSVGKYIDVDGEGKRLWAEGAKAQTYQGRLTYVHAKGTKTKMGLGTWWGITDSGVPNADVVKECLDSGATFKADTLEELAGIIGVPPANLVDAVKRYNEFVDSGVDLDFGQLKKNLKYKLAKPPFYAFNKCYYRHTDQGGVRINGNFQVIDRRNKVIPRLYAAGETEGGTHGIERDGGCGWTQCWVGGTRAGKHAASL